MVIVSSDSLSSFLLVLLIHCLQLLILMSVQYHRLCIICCLDLLSITLLRAASELASSSDPSCLGVPTHPAVPMW